MKRIWIYWFEHAAAHTQTLLTTCLYSWAVRVTQSDQCCLYQLREEDILTNQHKLSMAVGMPLTVTSYARICMLHHTVDWDHQTWQTDTESIKGAEGWAPMGPASCVYSLSSFQVLGVDRRSPRSYQCGLWKLLHVFPDPYSPYFSLLFSRFLLFPVKGLFGQWFLIRFLKN